MNIPRELIKPCKVLLAKIYRAFPGTDGPDLMTDIETLAQKCFDIGKKSGVADYVNKQVAGNEAIADIVDEVVKSINASSIVSLGPSHVLALKSMALYCRSNGRMEGYKEGQADAKAGRDIRLRPDQIHLN